MAVAIRASFRPGADPEAVSLATTAGVLFVRAIEAVGASRTAILVGVSPLLSAFFAISLLGEPIRAGLVLGTVAVVGGAVAPVSAPAAPARLTAAGATA